MGAGTVLGVDRSAARILGGSTSHRKGTPRKVVALIRAGGDVTRYWHWQALRTLGVVEISHKLNSHPSWSQPKEEEPIYAW